MMTTNQDQFAHADRTISLINIAEAEVYLCTLSARISIISRMPINNGNGPVKYRGRYGF